MSSGATSSVTPIRAQTGGGPAEQLEALVVDPSADPAAFDDVADAHPEAWAAATVMGALARIAAGDRDGSAGAKLQAVADSATDDAAFMLATRLGATVHGRAAAVAVASAAGRDSVVLALTHGVEAVDDVTALLVTYRATALARVGMVVSAQEAVDRVLRSRKRHPAVKGFARRQRDVMWRHERMP